MGGNHQFIVCVYYSFDLIDYFSFIFFLVPQVIVCLRKDRVARTAPVSITNVTAMTVTEDADVRLQVRCHYHFFF